MATASPEPQGSAASRYNEPTPEPDDFDLDLSDKAALTKATATTYIKRSMEYWKHSECFDSVLWMAYKEGFAGADEALFNLVSSYLRATLRDFLRERGVWIGDPSQSTAIKTLLVNLLNEAPEHEWTPEDIILQNRYRGFHERSRRPGRVPLRASGTILPEPIVTYAAQGVVEQVKPEAGAETHAGLDPLRTAPKTSEERSQNNPNSQLSPDLAETQFLPFQYQLAPTVLTNLSRLYKDEEKFAGTEDTIDYNITIFRVLCRNCQIGPNTYHLAISHMLTGDAKVFYYNEIAGKRLMFNEQIALLRLEYETPEREEGLNDRWHNTSLVDEMAKHPDMNIRECFDLTVKILTKAHRGLSKGDQKPLVLRGRLITACKGVEELEMALFRPSPTWNGLCAEIRNNINIKTKSKGPATFQTSTVDHNYTDRTLHKTGGNGRQQSKGKKFDSTKKVCWICHQPNHYHWQHTDEEIKTNKEKYAKFLAEKKYDSSPKSVSTYIALFEGEPDLTTMWDSWHATIGPLPDDPEEDSTPAFEE